jgi:hypothetical protein
MDEHLTTDDALPIQNLTCRNYIHTDIPKTTVVRINLSLLVDCRVPLTGNTRTRSKPSPNTGRTEKASFFNV